MFFCHTIYTGNFTGTFIPVSSFFGLENLADMYFYSARYVYSALESIIFKVRIEKTNI